MIWRLLAVLFAFVATPAWAQTAADCTALARVDLSALPDAPTTITAATIVPATPDLPAHCRVEGTVAPQVGFEVRLPMSGWNGRYLQQGCGGMCGLINMGACEDAQARNYAVANTDMGHKGSPANALWALDNRAAELDFAYRATYVTSVAAKAIVARFYGRPQAKSYFRGCSTGGRQALILAQRFPHAFDGIVAGAPVLSQTGVSLLHLLWSGRANLDADGRPILSPEHVKLIGKSAIMYCDAADGSVDGILQDPGACRWSPQSLACVGDQTGACLTATHIAAANRLYDGARDSRGNALFAGGMPRGSEHQWAPAFVGSNDQPALVMMPGGLIDSVQRYQLYWNDTPSGPLPNFDFDRDVGRLALIEPLYNAQNPDLTAFRARGGKLILWHGWDDLEIPARLSIDYFRKVEATMGGRTKTRDFARLFLLPGVAHCRRGPGADAFDELSAIEAWVERGAAPDSLATHKLVTDQTYLGLPRPRFPLPAEAYRYTRPVPAFPLVAVRKGGEWRFTRMAGE